MLHGIWHKYLLILVESAIIQKMIVLTKLLLGRSCFRYKLTQRTKLNIGTQVSSIGWSALFMSLFSIIQNHKQSLHLRHSCSLLFGMAYTSLTILVFLC